MARGKRLLKMFFNVPVTTVTRAFRYQKARVTFLYTALDVKIATTFRP